jgi:hypothetical protein
MHANAGEKHSRSRERRMNRLTRSLACCATAALAITPLSVAAPSEAAGTTLSVSTSPLTIATGTPCVTFPIAWYVSPPDGTDWWDINGDIVTTAGASASDIFEYEDTPVTQATTNYTLCVAPGTTTYTVAATIDSYDDDSFYNDHELKFSQPLTITYTPPPPPPPPTPSTYTTQVRLTGIGKYRGTHRADIDFIVKVTASCGSCSNRPRPFTVQGRGRGSWHTLKTGRVTYGSEFVDIKVPYRYRKLRVHVLRAVEDSGLIILSSAASPIVKVPSKPRT